MIIIVSGINFSKISSSLEAIDFFLKNALLLYNGDIRSHGNRCYFIPMTYIICIVTQSRRQQQCMCPIIIHISLCCETYVLECGYMTYKIL